MNNPIELVHYVSWQLVAKEDYGKTLAELKAGGVDTIVGHDVWGDPDPFGSMRHIRKLADAEGIRIPAAHGLWRRKYDLAFCESEGMEAHRKYIDALAECGVRTYTVHPGFSFNPVDDGFFSHMRDTMGLLIEACKGAGMVLAVENGVESMENLGRAISLVAEFNTPYCGMCCDVGHANCFGHKVEEVIDAMSPWIVTMHLHDNHGVKDDHAAAGNGNIDWKLIGRKIPGLPRLIHVETETGTPTGDPMIYHACRKALDCPSIIVRKHQTR